MKRSQNSNQTRRHRLLEHDYSTPGYYFVTFGTRNKQHLLGTISDDHMLLSPTGHALQEIIQSVSSEHSQMELDSFTIMPNHVHLLIYLRINQDTSLSISEIVRKIKGRSTAEHRHLVGENSGLWHKGFHDTVVRTDQQLNEVRRYIAENPLRWQSREQWW